MSIPSSIGEAQKARSRDTGLQFVIGQDETGHWVAVESNGRGGGIFVSLCTKAGSVSLSVQSEGRDMP
jgi:hypothetical protein